jgi:hypothetical protein
MPQPQQIPWPGRLVMCQRLLVLEVTAARRIAWYVHVWLSLSDVVHVGAAVSSPEASTQRTRFPVDLAVALNKSTGMVVSA